MAITIPILTDFKGEGIDRGIAQFNKLEGAGSKAGFLIRKAALPAAAALGALGAGAVVAAKAAAEDAAAQDKLAGTLRRVTGASDAAVASTEDYISSMSQSLGVADDELRPALGKLATATGDLTKAQDLLKIALDVSAQTGKPLDGVVTGLAKAYGGNLGALKKLIPGFDEGIIKSKDFAAAQDELARLTGGAATANANTAAGQFRKFQITLEETKESIGAALLPIFQAFLPILQRAGQFVQDNTGLFIALAGAVATVSGAVLIANGVMKAYQAIAGLVKVAQIALNIAMSANPIGIVVVAIGALVGALVLAYNKSETFRGAVETVFGWLKKLWDFLSPIASSAFNGLKSAFDAVWGAIDPLVTALKAGFNAAKAVWDFFAPVREAQFGGVKKAFEFITDPIGTVKDLFNSAKNAAKAVWDFLTDIGEKAFNGVKKAFEWITAPIDAVAAGLRAVKTAWESLFNAIEGKGGNPFAPGGGLAPGGVGTGGRPITGPRSIRGLAMSPGVGTASTRSGGINVVVQAGLVSTPDQVGQQIVQAIQRSGRRSGPAFAPA